MIANHADSVDSKNSQPRRFDERSVIGRRIFSLPPFIKKGGEGLGIRGRKKEITR